MITLQDWMTAIGYQINNGFDFLWKCYGLNAYGLDCEADDEYYISIIFDKKTQEVFEVTACDYRSNRSYRMQNPAFKAAYIAEAAQRNVNPNEAWHDQEYIDLEVDQDFLEKARAIISGNEYDDRIQVELELPNGELNLLMREAHRRDITFNQLVEETLKNVIEQHQSQ